ncbi:RNA polymerase, sigma-24 subunit, ECF subfamily [Gloeomargarita lithophora Alchichica-D10]|uniref:RNA polymerase, sigma-24 subunit, ECF subfamily n=1 Tax=Gloeomargarita lithophora Alchichica-D10 TaxID=1188229 RepID=A0A1J0ABN2_9CYAN|nr:sigma-70 family RNA polymerase sigma factor [Gloeomargarita lithophora]APB33325.1 RNA polymerase, sigma-24 subunit, ECF subfamily [Gloeomargarita lithophora Alchichica-D10]
MDDETLLERIAIQDQSALNALYDRYSQVIYSLIYRIVGVKEEAEEIILDVFLQVWRTAHCYNPHQAQVNSWLFMIARSRALDRLRRQSRQQRTTLMLQQTQMPLDLSSPPEAYILGEETHQNLQNALAQLPPEQRQAVELAYYYGLSHTQIAVRLGVPPGTIKSRIRMALQKMRQAFHIAPEQ